MKAESTHIKTGRLTRRPTEAKYTELHRNTSSINTYNHKIMVIEVHACFYVFLFFKHLFWVLIFSFSSNLIYYCVYAVVDFICFTLLDGMLSLYYVAVSSI